MAGLLYLEHAAAGAFTEAGVELLGLLAGQAAMALENARLLAELTGESQRLEAEVAQRTAELRGSNEELAGANQRLEVELAERERAERERSALQAQMLEAQRARLAELSTPLIPISDQIMVMPLIGTMDAERAAQVLEAALGGAQRHRARVVILDITGMRHVDSSVAGTLMKTAGALRLLGAEAVLTGIRPEVAQAIVGLGIDLAGIVTMGTLQAGIAYAMSRKPRAKRG
jgi:anti-anti-sigma factor